MDEILDIVIKYTGVSRSDILSKKRDNDICEARQIFIYVANIEGWSQISIAKYLSRTKQTISDQLNTISKQISIYNQLVKKVEVIKNNLYSDINVDSWVK